ncbi:MAG: RsmB/NOP family class I SAM-dependent RNA methyltransferase [Rhodospirillales bacterium]|nr:RsmB/NOP family class I SAM-dependent RNA methyltransferase [Rhodospirillales bacterium]MCB9973449.1 RsmB/NOP family class I SAM-dependent RNA methyltransferase [Rhodospirillales bacterium]
MKPSARIQTSIDLLERIYQGRVPMDTTCGDYFRVRRYIGSKDRAAIVERVYEIMRLHARLGYILAQTGLEDTPRARVIAHLALAGNPQRIKDLFDGEKYAPPILSSEEEQFLHAFKEPSYPEGIAAECPTEYEAPLRALFAANFLPEMQAMLSTATLDLRVNLAKCTREKAKAYLEADGVKTAETPYSPWGLRCENKAYLSHTKAFGKGWVEIQDEGSQLIGYLCAAQPGMQVLDYCAGAGGKTLVLAAAMQNKGRIVAMDLEERRLMKSKERLKKAGVADIVEVRPLSDEKHKKWLKRQKGTFDLVLCDVPCSGTGTWRRNPDMRWHTYGPSVAELNAIQADILDKVVHTVKEGGRLVYATCSLLREENEDQITAFLERHPEFEITPVPTELSRPDSPFMRLSPYKHGTDGFFTAILQKKKSES